MQVRFGNLSVLEFEDKTDVQFSDKDFIWLNRHRAEGANFKDENKFHIFDLPLGIVAGRKAGPSLIKRFKKYDFQKHFYVEIKESDF